MASCLDYDDLIEYSPDYYDSDENIDREALICSKCKKLFDTQRELRQHTAVVHNGWPLVLQEGVNEEEGPAKMVYVCSLCFGQYELVEELRRHIIDFHKYQSTEENREDQEQSKPIECDDVPASSTKALNKIVEQTITQSSAENSDYMIVATPAKALSPDETKLELRPLPFKNFRLLLRSKMHLRCTVSKSCVYKFETADKLNAHAKCHVSATRRDFKCTACSQVLENWRRCSTHLWKAHQVDVDLLHCPLCEFKEHASVLVWRHMRFHKKWRPRVLKSMRKVRDKRQGAESLKQNVVVDKPNPPVPNKNRYYSEKTCEVCSRKFVNGKTLSKHVKSVHNKIKPFICNVCGKKMARKASLIVHMRQHTGEKPLQCKTCKFATRDPSVLKKHQMRHEKTGKHKCNLCDYVSIQSTTYKRHMRLKHPEEYTKISCDLCNFVTVNEQRLQAHKEDHRKGLIVQMEDSLDASASSPFKNPHKQNEKQMSADCFIPLESIDSLPHEPTVDTGGVTIPALSEDTQFPTYLN